jgi:hypothetical protein
MDQRKRKASEAQPSPGAHAVILVFATLQGAMAVLFALAGVVLLACAAITGWEAVQEGLGAEAAQAIIEAVGLLAAAVVALQIAQTIAEEEVIRDVHVSAPTRVRRFLSRFLVVVVVALAIEGVVATFKAVHEGMEKLLYAGALLAGTALVLAAWGWFVRMNVSAERLEPEAMRKAKEEDKKLEQ